MEVRDSPFFLIINLCNFLYILIIVWGLGFSFVTGLAEKLYKILYVLSMVFFQNAGGTPDLRVKNKNVVLLQGY